MVVPDVNATKDSNSNDSEEAARIERRLEWIRQDAGMISGLSRINNRLKQQRYRWKFVGKVSRGKPGGRTKGIKLFI